MSPTKQELCFDLHHFVTQVAGCLELLQDENLPTENRKRIVELGLKYSKAALDLSDKLFKDISRPLFENLPPSKSQTEKG